MKRFISILLTLILMISLSSCAGKPQTPVSFYYQATKFKLGKDQSIITPEIRDASGYYGDYYKLMETYLSGPIEPDFQSPFPTGTSLISLDIGNTWALIVLSPHLSTLNGHQLTIACACIGKTLFEMVDVRSVEIKSQDSLLNGMQSVILSRNDLLLWDSYAGE